MRLSQAPKDQLMKVIKNLEEALFVLTVNITVIAAAQNPGVEDTVLNMKLSNFAHFLENQHYPIA